MGGKQNHGGVIDVRTRKPMVRGRQNVSGAPNNNAGMIRLVLPLDFSSFSIVFHLFYVILNPWSYVGRIPTYSWAFVHTCFQGGGSKTFKNQV